MSISIMTESSQGSVPTVKPTRFFKMALVIFPLGLILSGIASFGIWHMKRSKVDARSYQWATALRRDLNEAAIERAASILREVLQQPRAQAMAATASFLESSMSAENMGYSVRRESFFSGPDKISNVDVELTGKKRWQEILMVLVPYGQADRVNDEAQALAGMMTLAHSVTGEIGTSTLRFAAIPAGVKDNEGHGALAKFAATARAQDERFMQVYVLGGPSDAVMQEVSEALNAKATGVILTPVPATADNAATLALLQELRPKLLEAAAH